MHAFADVGDVGEHALLVAVAVDLGWRDRVPLARGGQQRRVGGVQGREETIQELERVSTRVIGGTAGHTSW